MQKNKTLVFSIQQWLYWCAFGCFNNYVATIALSRGFPPSFVSNMLAMGGAAGLTGMIVGGLIGDRLRTNKKVILFCIGMLLPANILLYCCHRPVVFYALYLLVMVVNGPVYANLDTWLLRACGYNAKVYGQVRSIGAVGLATGMLVTGFLMKAIGYQVTVIAGSVLYGLSLLVSLSLKDSTFPTEDQTKKRPQKSKALSALLNPAFMLLCVFVLFLGFTINPYHNLKIMVLRSVGGDVDWQGLDTFCALLVQSLCLFFSEKLTRAAKPHKRLLQSACLMLLAVVTAYFANAPQIVVIASCLQQGGYGVLISTLRQLTAALVPAEHQTFANSIADACYSQIAMLICLPIAGVVVEKSGVRSMLLLSWGTAAVAIALAVTMLVTARRKRVTVCVDGNEQR